MFHTFETSKLVDAAQPNTHSQNANSTEVKLPPTRRTSTVRACEPCRKRKIRCNGELPCETCQWYRKASSCNYTEPRQRQIPSRKSVEKITSTLEDYRNILQQLFPNTHPDALTSLPRERLLELINKSSSNQPPSPATSSGGPIETSSISPNAEAGGLETLQQMPEETPDSLDISETNTGIVDEVNALSLSVKVSSSYQGISSVMAVLRVILWIYPESQNFFTYTPGSTSMPSRAQSPQQYLDAGRRRESVFTGRDGLYLLNSYFTYVHPLIPLIEEQSFRETYHSGTRGDSRWLALLNMIFAMGSLAASDAEDKAHHIYFERSQQHLGGLNCLGSAHLETVQTLAIMGGLYLHYLQRPNLANSVMGACLRMATALGLHREYVDTRPRAGLTNPAFSADMRRRVWWSVFVLDSLANMTLGRPSMGRWGPAITAKPPQHFNDRGQGPATLCLIEHISFCKIATQIEDALAITPLVPNPEMNALDNALVEWYRNLPPTLQPHDTHGIPECILSTRTIMRWRYRLTRLVLHRPHLLNYAMRRIPFSQLRQDERESVETCRLEARELISDIAQNHRPNQMCGWNGLWFTYQAVMVPLLSLFSDPHDPSNVSSSSISVELGLEAMNQMKRYSPTGKRSIDAASRIYEASKRLITDTRSMHDKSTNTSTPTPAHPQNQQPFHPHSPPPKSTTNTGLGPLLSYSPNLIPDFFVPASPSSFLPFDPNATATAPTTTNLTPRPNGAIPSDLDIQTMWDSLNWSNGLDNFGWNCPMETSGNGGDGMMWEDGAEINGGAGYWNGAGGTDGVVEGTCL